MTTNILLNETGTEPIRTEEEFFILKRNDISYRILPQSKTQYTGEGYIILTSNRLVIFPTRQNTHFKAIEIPLNKIYDEQFKQPLFGKNYLTGKCSPVFASAFGAFTFTIWLKGNRMGTLIGAFYTLLDSLRNNQGKNHDENVIKALKENSINELFAIDPEDNSFIYQIQPPSANIPKQNYQSEIINRPPGLNNFNNFNRGNNNININNNSQIQLNEEQVKRNNDLYMSTFIYRNPNNNQNKFVYKDPGFVYKNPNNNNINNIRNNNNDDDDLVSPYNPKENNNTNIINNNINYNFNNNINNNYNYNISNNFELRNPYIPRNIEERLQSPNQNQIQNNIPINMNPKFNNSYISQNRMYMNPNSQNNQNNINININNKQNNQLNNPYSQIMNNPINNKAEKMKNNMQNKNINKRPFAGGYQNLREENDNEYIINNEHYSINSSFNLVDDSNINLENNQDNNLLQRLNSDDLIPDSNVSNPYA